MKLNEKIYYCRKKAGLSQEALAEKAGVSRQAVSKWETGDAVPELGKLPILASTFGVTADWLLSEDEPREEKTKAAAFDDGLSRFDGLIDKAIAVAEKLFKKYVWLCGVLISLLGVYRILSIVLPLLSMPSFVSGNFWLIYIFQALIGVAMIIGGIILAIVLKKWCKKQQ